MKPKWTSWSGITAAIAQAEAEVASVRADHSRRVIDGAAVTVLTLDGLCDYILCLDRSVEKTLIGTLDMLGLSVNAAARITEEYRKASRQPLVVRPDTTSRVVAGSRSATPHYMAGLAVALATYRAALVGKDAATVDEDADRLYVCFCARVVM